MSGQSLTIPIGLRYCSCYQQLPCLHAASFIPRLWLVRLTWYGRR